MGRVVSRCVFGNAAQVIRLLCFKLLLAAAVTLAMIGSATCAIAGSMPEQPTVAFFYGANPPLADLRAFDIAVVEPAHVPDPKRHMKAATEGAHELFAYVSIGEVQPSRPYYSALPAGAIRTGNAAWGSGVIDQATSGWQDFFLDRIVGPLWEQGWRGFFIDTLDSYQLFATTDSERQVQAAALIGTLRELKRRYPDARLILNRGFELLPEVAPITFAVAAESLYQGYDARRKRYGPVAEDERAWLLAQLENARDRFGLPVIAIDYVSPDQTGSRAAARNAAAQIRAHGIIPWVADGGLNSIGIGAIEVIPRNVLVVVDTSGGVSLDETEAQRFLGMPLNYLGLRYEFVDLANDKLPEGLLAGRYAGIVTWLPAWGTYDGLASWLRRQIDSGMRVAVFHSFGFNIDEATGRGLGLQPFMASRAERLVVQSSDKEFIGFESEALPDRGLAKPLRLVEGAGKSLLRMKDQRGNVYDAAALTRWGGYALAPFTANYASMAKHHQWILHPISFLKAALALPDLPVPDVTTESGRRILMIHIDGDGFASRAEVPGAPFAADLLRKDFIERYRMPTTMSVIESELSSKGQYPHLTSQLEPIARSIFALPYIEGASHTFSHPFVWRAAIQGAAANNGDEPDKQVKPHLDVPHYRFDLTREIKGSADYIAARLMPKEKAVGVLLWTGDCVVPPAGIAEAYRHGLLNMNGGDTVITDSQKTWTYIAANGIRKKQFYQVYAPNQNENVYTGNWMGPFYGYERVIETFRLTGEPIRFKPVNIYYHVYSATKPASIAALHKVYRWAASQQLTPVWGSQYIRKVLDFETTTIAKDLETGDVLVRTGSDLRTLRLPPAVEPPSIAASSGVAGISPGPSGHYLTMAAPQVRLRKGGNQEAVYLVDASGPISELRRQQTEGAQEMRFMLTSIGRSASFSLAKASGCSVSVNGKAIKPVVQGVRTTMSDSTKSPRSKKGNTEAGGHPASAIQYYDLGPTQQSDPATRHLALIRCSV